MSTQKPERPLKQRARGFFTFNKCQRRDNITANKSAQYWLHKKLFY